MEQCCTKSDYMLIMHLKKFFLLTKTSGRANLKKIDIVTVNRKER